MVHWQSIGKLFVANAYQSCIGNFIYGKLATMLKMHCVRCSCRNLAKMTYILKLTWMPQLKVCSSMHDLLLPPGIKGLKDNLEIIRNNQMKLEAFRQLCCSENVWKIPRKSFRRERMLKAHKQAEYKQALLLMFFQEFPKNIQNSYIKRKPFNKPLFRNLPYFIKGHLWMSASDETTLKKSFGESKPSSKFTLKTKW